MVRVLRVGVAVTLSVFSIADGLGVCCTVRETFCTSLLRVRVDVTLLVTERGVLFTAA